MKRLLLFLLLAAGCIAAARSARNGRTVRFTGQHLAVGGRQQGGRSGRKRHLRIGGQRTGRGCRRTHDPCRHGDESPLPPLRAQQPSDPVPRVRPRHDTLSARTRRGCPAGWAHDGGRIRILSRRHRTYPAHDPPQRRFDGIFRERLHRLPLPARTVGNATRRQCVEITAGRHRAKQPIPRRSTASGTGRRIHLRVHSPACTPCLPGPVCALPYLQTGVQDLPIPSIPAHGRVHGDAVRPVHPLCGAGRGQDIQF